MGRFRLKQSGVVATQQHEEPRVIRMREGAGRFQLHSPPKLVFGAVPVPVVAKLGQTELGMRDCKGVIDRQRLLERSAGNTECEAGLEVTVETKKVVDRTEGGVRGRKSIVAFHGGSEVFER